MVQYIPNIHISMTYISLPVAFEIGMVISHKDFGLDETYLMGVRRWVAMVARCKLIRVTPGPPYLDEWPFKVTGGIDTAYS